MQSPPIIYFFHYTTNPRNYNTELPKAGDILFTVLSILCTLTKDNRWYNWYE